MATLDRGKIFKYLAVIILWGAFFALFTPFYGEILLAAVFALAIEPFLGRLLQKRHLRWRSSVALVLLAMFVVLAVPITALAYKTYAYVIAISRLGLQNTAAYKALILFREQFIHFANHTLNRFGLSDQIDLAGLGEESIGRIANTVMGFVSQMASHVPSILLSIFVFCSSLYYFLAEASPLRSVVQRQQVLSAGQLERLIRVLQTASYNVVVTTLIIAVMQGTLLAFSSWILNTGDPLVIWVITFIAAFVPLISAGPVAMALAIGDLAFGQVPQAIGFVVVATLAAAIDHGVRPYLMSSSGDDLHPIVSLLALIGGLILFGMPGLFLGPVTASVAVKIVPTLFEDVQSRANVR